jgi:hypothetical protein
MNWNRVGICLLTGLLASLPAGAQIAADLVAASGIPAGNNFAPHTRPAW